LGEAVNLENFVNILHAIFPKSVQISKSFNFTGFGRVWELMGRWSLDAYSCMAHPPN
jgi:hypothetical protein